MEAEFCHGIILAAIELLKMLLTFWDHATVG
jgi:hypothetical protein